jgi:hypothetical protein
MVYYIVACTKQGQDENTVQKIVENNVLANGNRPLGELFSLTKSIDKTQFKLGSLDELMQLMDTFQKLDVSIDASCRRNERMY